MLTPLIVKAEDYRVDSYDFIVEISKDRNYKYEENLMDNPFEPKMRPMIVNLVKENDEYKVIVDLIPLEDNENAVNINFDKKTLNAYETYKDFAFVAGVAAGIQRLYAGGVPGRSFQYHSPAASTALM